MVFPASSAAGREGGKTKVYKFIIPVRQKNNSVSFSYFITKYVGLSRKKEKFIRIYREFEMFKKCSLSP